MAAHHHEQGRMTNIDIYREIYSESVVHIYVDMDIVKDIDIYQVDPNRYP